MTGTSLDIATLHAAYAAGHLTPQAVMREILRRIAAAGEDHVWIARRPDEALLAEAAALSARLQAGETLPLLGVPFAVKDNIDAAGLPTTAACPDFAHLPTGSAPSVARLIAAGAILVGKTNLDQFATGLVGVRSPYGIPRNPFDPAMIPGGSSSGSAVAVAAGLVSFALGTDTAGSGRVPAAFNNIVGLKPTRGLVSTSGVVPACRSLDCVSVFALTVPDGLAVLDIAAGFDPADAYSRPATPGFSLHQAAPSRFRFAVPRRAQRRFFGDASAETLFDAAIDRAIALGGEPGEIDFAPWTEAADLLYGPFVAERTAALQDRLRDRPDTLHSTTRAIVANGLQYSAVQVLHAQHRLQALAQAIRPVWSRAEFLLVPTTGTAFTLAQLEADPIARNTELGTYTNFTNLLDLAAVAVPGGFDARGFPAGVTLIGPAWHDGRLAAFATAMHRAAGTPLGATGAPQPAAASPRPARPGAHPYTEIAVFGAHLSGQPLNGQLQALGGVLRRPCRTTPHYRLLALPPTRGLPERPGLARTARDGIAVDGEVWALPTEAVAAFLASIAPPLGLGTVQLAPEDGVDTDVLGFICEGGVDAPDISHHGGWRAYRQAKAG